MPRRRTCTIVAAPAAELGGVVDGGPCGHAAAQVVGVHTRLERGRRSPASDRLPTRTPPRPARRAGSRRPDAAELTHRDVDRAGDGPFGDLSGSRTSRMNGSWSVPRRAATSLALICSIHGRVSWVDLMGKRGGLCGSRHTLQHIPHGVCSGVRRRPGGGGRCGDGTGRTAGRSPPPRWRASPWPAAVAMTPTTLANPTRNATTSRTGATTMALMIRSALAHVLLHDDPPSGGW